MTCLFVHETVTLSGSASLPSSRRLATRPALTRKAPKFLRRPNSGEVRMAKQRDPRPLSIGSAVRFTHNGETIHGHLLQRQGRRRFAKVIDPEERTWKVPESALKATGGARRTTMVTPHDEARANYRLGDRVAFAGPVRPMRGEIVKLNPKRAPSDCLIAYLILSWIGSGMITPVSHHDHCCWACPTRHRSAPNRPPHSA